MAQFVTCELCGANLDPNERCDCQKKSEAAPIKRKQPHNIKPTNSLPYNAANVKSKRGCKCGFRP
jgi:hypothetical protein